MRHLTYLILLGIFLLYLTHVTKNHLLFNIAQFCLALGAFGAIFMARHLREKKLDDDFSEMLRKRFEK